MLKVTLSPDQIDLITYCLEQQEYDFDEIETIKRFLKLSSSQNPQTDVIHLRQIIELSDTGRF